MTMISDVKKINYALNKNQFKINKINESNNKKIKNK